MALIPCTSRDAKEFVRAEFLPNESSNFRPLTMCFQDPLASIKDPEVTSRHQCSHAWYNNVVQSLQPGSSKQIMVPMEAFTI